MKRIQCSHYSNLDDLVINTASKLGFPLIGGTALEVWANHLKASGVRKRSDNDLDFIAPSKESIEPFRNWLFLNIDPDKVKTDMYIADPGYEKFITEIDGIKIMSLPFLLWSKITRPNRKETDDQDIRWILSLSDVSDEEIEEVFNELGSTPKEQYDLYKFIGCTEEVAQESSGYYPD